MHGFGEGRHSSMRRMKLALFALQRYRNSPERDVIDAMVTRAIHACPPAALSVIKFASTV